MKIKALAAILPLILPIFIFLALPQSIYSQLVGWIRYKDKDNNSYYISASGKIMTEEKPDASFMTVSADGIEYYLSQGEMLCRRFFPVEGLRLLKSVRFLGDVDRRMYTYSAKASEKIVRLKKKEGTRFDEYNREAALMLCRLGDDTYISNDYFGYSLKFTGNAEVLEYSIVHREQYGRGGVLLGLKRSERNRNGYDLLMLINSEQYRGSEISGLSQFKEVIAAKTGENIDRAQVESSEKTRETATVKYRFRDIELSGKRLITVNRNTGVSVTLLAPDSGAAEELLKDIINSFVLVDR